MKAAAQTAGSLDEVVRTEELARRAYRMPDHALQNEALTTLSRALAASPHSILQTLCLVLQKVCGADSAGVSLLEQTDQGAAFFWPAITGAWQGYVGGGTPRDFGPCGTVLDRSSTQLFVRPQRFFSYLQAAEPPIEEGLLAPFFVAGKAMGTVWVVSHQEGRHFDLEDQRRLESVAAFASGAYQVIKSMEVLEERARERERGEQAMREADRRKNEFLAMLAHELRNPIAPIRDANELLSHIGSTDVRAEMAVNIIRRQVTQLARLVDDLLDVSRIAQGRIDLKLKPVDVVNVITQAVETVEAQLREKRDKLSILAASYEPLYVHADFARLVQCVANLLSNAAKYSEPEAQIWIRTRAEQSSVIIEIADTGVGISAELLPRVFGLFVQSDRTLDRAQGGLGIGLAIVKAVVELHGGSIDARSEGLGCGSTFEIRLPRIARPEPASVEPAAIQGASRRVLIVDDNADAAIAISMLLSLQGHQTQVAQSGKEALAQIDAFRPEIALLDIGLPEMSGYELAQRLRACPQLAGLRLIALSGFGQAEDQERTRAAGFDHHLVKPVDLQVLDRALRAD